jgi:putative sterol carrier protein
LILAMMAQSCLTVSRKAFAARNWGEPADTHIAVSWTDWLALMHGSLDPRRAINNGKIVITGDMNNVAKLIELGHRLF